MYEVIWRVGDTGACDGPPLSYRRPIEHGQPGNLLFKVIPDSVEDVKVTFIINVKRKLIPYNLMRF